MCSKMSDLRNSKPEMNGKKPQGQPIQKWTDRVQKDPNTLGTNNGKVIEGGRYKQRRVAVMA